MEYETRVTIFLLFVTLMYTITSTYIIYGEYKVLSAVEYQ